MINTENEEAKEHLINTRNPEIVGSGNDDEPLRHPSNEIRDSRKIKKFINKAKIKEREKRFVSESHLDPNNDQETYVNERFHITPRSDWRKWSLLTDIKNYTNQQFEVYIPDVGIKESFSQHDPVPSNILGVKVV